MTPRQIFARLLQYFNAYKARISGGLVAVAVMSGSDALSAYLIATLFDVLQSIADQVKAGAAIVIDIPLKVLKMDLGSVPIRGTRRWQITQQL